MGASIVNLQIWTKGNAQEEWCRGIAEILKKQMGINGFVMAEAHEKSQWTFAMAYALKTPWVGVYEDVGASRLDPTVLEELAVIISKEMETHALVSMVCDSDVLMLSLFSHGEKLETYNSCPEYFAEGISEEQLAQIQHNSECWHEMLIKGCSIEDLTRIWEEDAVFAEATLAALAQCMGMNSEQSVMGFEDLQDSEECQVTYLRFKK